MRGREKGRRARSRAHNAEAAVGDALGGNVGVSDGADEGGWLSVGAVVTLGAGVGAELGEAVGFGSLDSSDL